MCLQTGGMVRKMLTPMNHREIEYTTGTYWESQQIEEKNIADIFCEWSNNTEKEAALKLLIWLEETQKEVFQEDLLLDYGADCLRLYLMFEKTPEADDTWLDTWEECNLEGCYKFLSRFRRMILVADYANGMGMYQKLDATTIKNRIYMLQAEVMQHLAKGNTMPNRHNALSVIMEGMKHFHKELGIGELVTSLHSHEIAMAVPHVQKEEETEAVKQDSLRNKAFDEVLKEMLLLFAPFAPVLAEHLWQRLKYSDASIFKSRWKSQNTKPDMIKLPIQVNAKTKKVLTIHATTAKEEIEAMAKKELSQLLQGKEYQLIYVPEKIMNFVII